MEWDHDLLSGYSVDSSRYIVRPRVVVFPEDIGDVIRTVRFAAENGIGVTARGGGTGLVGGGIGDGIVIDMRGITGISLEGGAVTVGAGTSKGALDKILLKNGRFLSPNPSVGPYCTLGGMIATNAGGSLALKYGSMIDNVLEIEFVDGLGRIHRFPDESDTSSAILEIAGMIDRGRFPNVTKNSSGYRLDAVSSVTDIHKILAGSEGTLGIITSAKLRTFECPVTHRLIILGYESLYDATGDCMNLVNTGPECMELTDCDILRSVTGDIPGWAQYMLMIEYGDVAPGSIQAQNGRKIIDTCDHEEIKRWWRYRNSALAREMGNVGAYRTPQIFEDATVPLKDLGKLIDVIEEMRDMFDVRLAIYGHFGSGNPHVVLTHKEWSMEDVTEIAEWYFERVIALGGTITGEHGDGLARTGFVRRQYGETNFAAFRQLKRMLDPRGVLNPGKVVTQDPNRL